MVLRKYLAAVSRFVSKPDAAPVVQTAMTELENAVPGHLKERVVEAEPVTGRGRLLICRASALTDAEKGAFTRVSLPGKDGFIYLQLSAAGSGVLIFSHGHFLIGFCHFLLNSLTEKELPGIEKGRLFQPAFSWNRSVYDYFFTQEGRVLERPSPETYVRQLARMGMTHVEVNGLAFPMGLESGPRGETYPMFYTYCPALDQFVYSRLNRGDYPYYYLRQNLSRLKENARLASKYGITPGLLCFEPRSVPDAFFERYPMLRGARVDHPFRSFKPRYNMTITHPLVREHYSEMLEKLLMEIPELAYLSVWSNDSGAGFEHTKSLYVGRNGGAYLIREWKDDDAITREAGRNTLRFFSTLRDAARKINPDFRILTRLESFYGEHETIWDGLRDGLDAEANSVVCRGWESIYHHPTYGDIQDINLGTIYQGEQQPEEIRLRKELETRDSLAHFYYSVGIRTLFEPLLAIPYPRLTHGKLSDFFRKDSRQLAHIGGFAPPELAPFDINREIIQRFQFDPDMDIQAVIADIAGRWAGPELAATLQAAWELTEEAILAFPGIITLYSTFGFTWYRLWLRPLVPNLEAVPAAERAYYEDNMCTTPHNPNNVDLSRDVLFQLTTPGQAALNVKRMDGQLWKPLNRAIERLEGALKQPQAVAVIRDTWVRLKALRCWFTTQRNVGSWIQTVHGYLNCTTEADKETCRLELKDAIYNEIENSGALLSLLDSGVEFMARSRGGESPLVHPRELAPLWQKRITLMERHIEDEPYIDPDYIERQAGKMF